MRKAFRSCKPDVTTTKALFTSRHQKVDDWASANGGRYADEAARRAVESPPLHVVIDLVMVQHDDGSLGSIGVVNERYEQFADFIAAEPPLGRGARFARIMKSREELEEKGHNTSSSVLLIMTCRIIHAGERRVETVRLIRGGN